MFLDAVREAQQELAPEIGLLFKSIESRENLFSQKNEHALD